MEEENEIPFFVGETIKVKDGPFSSFQGTIEAVDNERKKLTVSDMCIRDRSECWGEY